MKPAAEPPSLDEKLDEWVDAHPEGKEFSEAAPVASTTGEPEQPTQETPPGGETAPGTAEAPPAEPVADKAAPPTEPAPQAKAEQPPPSKPETPAAAAAPIPFSLDAKYSFGEGTTPWSGQQVVDGLRERQELIPLAQEAATYREVFDMPAAQAKELWVPNLTWMRGNPRQVQMIASLMADQEKADYILQVSDYYESPEAREARGAQPAQQPQQLAMSPEVEARFKQLETQNRQLLEAETNRRKQHFTERITRELNTAFERYPYLRDNPQMVQALLARAYWINGGDDSENGKGVLDALNMERDLYDAKLSALNTATSIAHEAATPLPPVPPLMGSGGASPQATQPTRHSPKKFGTLDDAVDDWVSNPPAQFR
ncbi:MAG: hypothetical protein WCB99_08890 [Candidatus Cybelea sp.]